MKNFIKKRGVVAAAAVLLAVAAIFVTITCNNDIDNGDDDGDNFTIPAGKGAIKLSFDENVARTIMPGDPNLTVSDFDGFKFQFTPTIGSTGTAYISPTYIPSGNITDAITLDPGDYDLVVLAYFEMNKTSHGGNGLGPVDWKVVAANDPAVGVTITGAHTTNATIHLKAYANGVENGTFRYTITTSIDTADLLTAKMTLTNIATSVKVIDEQDIKAEILAGTQTDVNVVSGYYYVDFAIKVTTETNPIVFRHIAHIYSGQTSSYTFTLSPNYFNALFQLISTGIDYVHDGDNLPLLKYSDYILTEGDTIALAQGTSLTITVTNATTDFDGDIDWFCQSDTKLNASSASNFLVDATNSSKPFYDKKTYLLTVVGQKGTKKYYTFINIKVVDSTFTLLKPALSYIITSSGSPGSSTNWVENSSAVSLDPSNNDKVDITITNGSSDFTSVACYLDDPTKTISVVSNVITVDTTDTKFSTSKTYTLTVVGIKDGVKYYTNINVEVQ